MLDERELDVEAEELLSAEKRSKLSQLKDTLSNVKVTPQLIGTAVRTLGTLSELVLILDYLESVGEMFVLLNTNRFNTHINKLWTILKYIEI